MSMEKYYTPTEWENYPSEDTAINAMRLNHAEDGINELDDRIVELSTDKSEVDWNQILLSGEKIAEITINGIKKNVYTSNDSAKAEAQAYKAEGYATGEQNGIPVESGSPYYQNNAKYFKEQADADATTATEKASEASTSASSASSNALISEGYAVGKQNGSDVASGSPYYHNNAKYFSSQASSSASTATTKAGEASASATTASNKASEASSSATSASNSASTATTKAGEASASATSANTDALKAEGYSVGKQNGEDVGSGSPYYHNNAKYYEEKARSFTPEGYQELVDDVEALEENKVDKDASDETVSASGHFETVNGGKLETCVIAFEPKQSGSGEPSPSNVRPITGHSSVDVRVIDKDLLTHTATTQTLNGLTFTVSGTKITVNGTATAQTYIAIGSTGDLPQGDYWYSGLPSDASNNTYFITRSASSNNTASDRIWNTSGVQSPRIYVRNGVTCDNVVFDIAISKAYEKTTTSLGQTVYGGSLDVVSGVLTVTHEFAELNGSETWLQGSGQYANVMYTAIGYEKTGSIPISNYMKGVQSVHFSSLAIGEFAHSNAMQYRDYNFATSFTSIDEWKAYLASNPLQVVYTLATPITIQLTPQQINTLIGENNIDVPLTGQSLDSAVYREMFAWSDVEDVVELRLPISAIGTDESNNDNASQAYSQGDYFYKNGIAKAKTNIASGATFTLGTNYEIKTLAEILKALES